MPNICAFHRTTGARARIVMAGAAALAILAAASAAKAQTTKHPLDDLTAQEYWTTYEVLQASAKVDAQTRYPLIQLKEPPKEEVLAWKPGQPMRREALVVVKKGLQTFEAVVDVNGKKLVSWTEIKGVQPPSPLEESDEFKDLVKDNDEVKAALKKRGITDFNTVFCGGGPEGYYGAAEEEGRRLLRMICVQQIGPLEDGGVIEGLTVLLDINEKKVVRVIDTGVVPIPKAESNYDLASVGAIRDVPTPLTIQQPLGPSYRLDGQSVSWQKWNFHFRIDRRVGLVVSNVGYQDGGKLRSILYEGSLSEIFVPYMEPSEGWFARVFFDAGLGADGFASSLAIGDDRGKKNQKGEQGYDEVVRQRRGKRHGVVLFHVANHVDCRVLEVEQRHGDHRPEPIATVGAGARDFNWSSAVSTPSQRGWSFFVSIGTAWTESRRHLLAVAPFDICGQPMVQIRPRTRRMTTTKRTNPKPPVGA